MIGAGLLTALIGSFGAGACTVFDTEPIRAYDAGTGSGGTAGAGGGAPEGPWWETMKGDCRVASPPTRDDAPPQSEEADDGPEFVMAMTFIRLGATAPPAANVKDPAHLKPDPTAYLGIGFDVDGKCSASSTCRDADGGLIAELGCTPPVPVIATGQTDGTNCRDNAVGVTIPLSYAAPTTAEWFGVNENDWNCELHRGGYGVMFRIRKYNYRADDPTVTVDVYNTMGITTPNQRSWFCRGGQGGKDITAFDSRTYPDWRDETGWLEAHPWVYAKSNWDVDTGGPDFLPDAKVHTKEAYVKDNYLVAFLPPHSVIGFIGKNSVTSGIRLTFERGILAGRLVQETSGTWSLKNATLGGAVAPDTMLDAFEKIGYCENNMCGAYRTVSTVLDGVRDVFLDPTGKNPSETCDAMSIGMAIEAKQARLDGFTKEDDPFLVDCPQPRHPKAPPPTCTCPEPPEPAVADCGPDGGTGGTGGSGGSGGSGGNGDGGS
ncbi:MAG TPA: hypothetical protein VI072_08395 [Polyangiaceae bacterium]